MTDATPHLGLPLIAAAQAQKHVTHNEALGLLDALVQLACLDKDLAAPPPNPAEGDRYLVAAANPGGAWAGLSGQVVRFADGVWTGSVPRTGWFAYVVDEADLYIFDGTAWTSFRRAITAIQFTGRLGINTTPDGANRLAVKSDAALLSWDDVTPGSGDMRVALNKQAAARDAALVFQTGYSARALIGALGGDDFSLKVSGDGAVFATALTASAATGGIDFASAETALAAAATTDLGAAGTRRVLVTGAAAITGFGSSANRERFVRFSGAATLTHDAARLVLPTRANILTAADDTCLATSDAAGNWRVRHYQRADGTALLGTGVASVAGRTGTVTLAVADVAGAAPLASPALTGTPTVPTAAAGTSTQQAASTAFVAAGFVPYAYAAANYATAANATLTGTPTAPTQAPGDGSTRLATTAYADRAASAAFARTQVNDAAYAALPADRLIAFIALTAARTVSLPAASAFPQGARLLVVDESGACSGANTITLARSGTSDAVNGGASVTIASAYGYAALESNGANKWTLVDAPAPVTSVAGRTGTVALAVSDVAGAAPLASPALAGTPTAPNPAAGTSTAQIATTAFVAAGFVTYAYASATYATAASPTLTGTPTAPTPAAKDNSTKLATTAYADRGDAAMVARTQVNDAAYAILPADRTVAVIALTAARTLTLPPASAYPQGATLTVMDESGACSAVNTLSIARASAADAVNGAASAVIAVPFGFLALQSNGVNKWTVIDVGSYAYPARPAFNVYGPASGAANIELAWQTKTVDPTSSFNLSTGRFTAPVAGLYFVTASVLVSGSATSNGVKVLKNGASTSAAGGRQTYVATSSTYLQISTSQILSLAVGDYISLYTEVTLYAGNEGLSTFCGFLIG